MTFVSWIETHVRSLLLIAVALTGAGLAAMIVLPVGLFPQVAFPRVVVRIDSGDRPAEQMVLLVTKPVEQAVRSVPGVREVRSISSRGSGEIALNFDWGLDMISKTLEINSAMAQILPSLPPGTNYSVRRMDPTTFPIIAYSLTSTTNSLVKLRDLAQYQIVPLLSAINGVARVDVIGGRQAEIQVAVDPQRLDADGLTITDVVTALSAANQLSAVGRLQDHDKLYLLLADNTISGIEQVGGIVVKSDRTGLLRVRDVASVSPASIPEWIKVDADGKDAVLFQVYEQPDGNAVAIASEVRRRLEAFKNQIPPGVSLANWYDQSVLVTQSAGSVRDAILIGLGLAALVLFGFLRSVRVTVIAMIVVPATLSMTIVVLYLVGATFNLMTLGGIAAAVGLLIDDVIVMIEHIARRAGARDGSGGRGAVLPAAREFLVPLTGSSLATLIVFLPLGFLTGVTGAFFKALSLTMASALLISFALTAIIVPILARKLIDFERWHDPASHENWLGRQHRQLLDRLFAKPWLLACGIVPVLILGGVAFKSVGSGFMPAIDEGGFVIDYHTKPGTSLDETNRLLGQVEGILADTKEVATFSRRTGLGLGGDLNEPNEGDFFVRLKAGDRAPSEDVMAAIRARISAEVPGVDVELAQLMEDLIGDLTAVPQPIEIKLSGTNPTALLAAARKVAGAIGNINGVVEIVDGIKPAGDALRIHVDPAKAGMENADPASVSSAISAYVEGTVATYLPQSLKQIGVRVWADPDLRKYDDQLGELPIRASDGHLFPLKRVASVAIDAGEPQITRDNLRQIVAVTARIEGRDLGSTLGDVRRLLDGPGMLPSGISYELGGLYQQQQIAFAGLVTVFAAALVSELVLLLFLYEQIFVPLIILAISLLSTTAVFTGLWVSGVELNITAMMGMTMVIGIGTEMAIFYVSEFTELCHTMPPRKALVSAAQNRLRPIAMTTLAAILALSPLAIALGEGAAMQQPLAIAIIAGLMLQFPMVLLAMPVLIGLTLPKASSIPASVNR